MPRHTTLAAMARLVARAPPCDRPWKALKTAWRSAAGISGRGESKETSHNSSTPPSWTGTSCREDAKACLVKGQEDWWLAMAA
jgi:hypothetical protein